MEIPFLHAGWVNTANYYILSTDTVGILWGSTYLLKLSLNDVIKGLSNCALNIPANVIIIICII